jgi:hypothetical protein
LKWNISQQDTKSSLPIIASALRMRKANPNEEWKEICRIEHENDDNLEKEYEYEVKGLEPGKEYEFGVCGVNILGDGPFSDSIPIKTGLKEFRFERNDDTNGLIYGWNQQRNISRLSESS